MSIPQSIQSLKLIILEPRLRQTRKAKFTFDFAYLFSNLKQIQQKKIEKYLLSKTASSLFLFLAFSLRLLEHNINWSSSARGGFQEQKPTTRSLLLSSTNANFVKLSHKRLSGRR